MGMWKQPRPRGFHHEWIYVDERKERLKAIERKARQELDEEGNGGDVKREVRGFFRKETSRKRRQTESYGMLRSSVLQVFLLCVLLMLLLMVLIYLM